nr:ribonuclease H-like domain-containing protein [Tanacetum cinerariifolium]
MPTAQQTIKAQHLDTSPIPNVAQTHDATPLTPVRTSPSLAQQLDDEAHPFDTSPIHHAAIPRPTHLSQKKYAVKILERAGMVHCNPRRTPVDTESKLGDTGDMVAFGRIRDAFSVVIYIIDSLTRGSLQYLTFTRPDISYAVQQACLHMHDRREPHLSALKLILRYVRGTLDYGLQLFSSSTTDLVAYSDSTLSRSSAEVEYRGVANAVAETCWLRNLLRELHTPLTFATLVYCDNVSAIYLSCNSIQHQHTKHIEIDIHFVRDLVAVG